MTDNATSMERDAIDNIAMTRNETFLENIPRIKSEPIWDPYNSLDSQIVNAHNSLPNGCIMGSEPKRKRGRPKKVKEEVEMVNGVKVKQEKITDHMKVRKKFDRFKGTTEEEVMTRVLPDHLKEGLDICIVGINPGLTAAYVGHHYAGPGNHFWKCLFLSGLIPEQLNAYSDHKLLDHGIGFTNIVERTSRGSADLTKREIKEGGEILKQKIKKYQPKIAVFNGKGIYEVFVGHKNFHIGKQPDCFPDCPNTKIFVMPSSSARFTQLPRAIDKAPFYVALKKYRDYLNGKLQHLDASEIYFPNLDLKVKLRPETIEAQAAAAAAKGEKPTKKPKNPKVKKAVKGQNEDLGQGQLGAQFQMTSECPVQFGGQNLFDNTMNLTRVKQEPVDAVESPYFVQTSQPQNVWPPTDLSGIPFSSQVPHNHPESFIKHDPGQGRSPDQCCTTSNYWPSFTSSVDSNIPASFPQYTAPAMNSFHGFSQQSQSYAPSITQGGANNVQYQHHVFGAGNYVQPVTDEALLENVNALIKQVKSEPGQGPAYDNSLYGFLSGPQLQYL